MLGSKLSSIKHRSFLAVGLIMTLFGVMFTSHYILTKESLKLLHSSERKTFPILQILDQSLTRLKDYQESLQAAVATNDIYAIDDAHLIGEEIQSLLKKVETLDPVLQTRAAPIRTQFKSYRQSAEDLTRRVIAKEISFSGENAQIKSHFAIQEENFQRIHGFRDEIHSYYIHEIRQTSNRGETTISRGIVLIILSLAIALFILIFLQTSIITPIMLLASASRKVALGSFSLVPGRKGQDEVSQLTNDFNRMISSLELSSRTMLSIIEHGRRMAVSSSLPRLRTALADGLGAYSDAPLPHEFWVSLRTLVRGESVDNRFILVSPEGELLSDTCSLEDLQKRSHISVRNHYDESIMAVIVCFEPDFESSPVKSFIEAIAIHVASALDSIKLQDTMNLVKEQSQSMRTLLENIDQGICTIDSSLNIHGPYSPFLEKIVGVQGLEGVSFFEAVIRKSVLNTEQKSILLNILNVCFDEDFFAYEVNRHQLIRELEWWKDGKKIVCEIDWIPLGNRHGLTERFMIVLRDVTHLRLLQMEAETNMRKLTLIDVLLNVDPDRFSLVIGECEATLLSMQKSLHSADRTASLWQGIRRNLHTEKGNLRALGLKSLSTCLHELEDAIESYLRRPADDSSHETNNLSHQLMVADGELKLVSRFFYDTLRRGRSMMPQAAGLKDEQIMMWMDRLQNLSGDSLARELASSREKICRTAAYGHQALISQLENAHTGHATSLGFHKLQILWSGTPLLFQPQAFNQILSAFHHLVRNSLDHGFTKAAESIIPIIRVEAQLLAHGRLRLIYQDNGNGLNLKQLQHKLSQAQPGLLLRDDHQLSEFIFTQGVSVKDNISETSGRGIGMDAVRSTCEKLGGTIHVCYTAPATADGYRAFAFEMELAVQDILSWPLPNTNLQVA
jgi:HAMP domain-containing protein/two-component sensor histidine kinase/HPt (histidine-containing phosphotransfer) domain-containing protein